MAAPEGRFFIERKMRTAAPHHESFKALWETKWKRPCEMGVYPFMFGALKDFEPVVNELIKKGMKEPYDWNAYAETFFPAAQRLVREASHAERLCQWEKASELFLRASALYRIARFPAPRSEKQKFAWIAGKEACLNGLRLREHPVEEVQIPHVHALPSEGSSIPAYYQIPKVASANVTVPLIILITGLDGYRTELVVWAESWRQCGCACLILEIPGTGDSPADPSDPLSPDRQFSSVLDWIFQQEGIDTARLIAWGFSTGGFYSIRLAHTHADKLLGVVSQGGGCHYMFDRRWLDAVNHLEYPFDLASALGYKFGYGDDSEAFKQDAMKFSLLLDGTLDRPCTRLLLGTEDEIYPIDDYYLAQQRGAPKEVRFVPETKHMGEPDAFIVILDWIYKLVGIEAVATSQLKKIPFRPRF